MAKRPRKKKHNPDPERPQRATDYARVLGRVFDRHKLARATEFPLSRPALIDAASEVGVSLPKNLGDILYAHRYRTDAPDAIAVHEPPGKEWVVFGAGKGEYRFVLVRKVRITANTALKPVKIPDATPEIIREYALNDEQALLAKIRYNRLIDLFLGIVAYPLQSHLRTYVKEVGQIEVDELYAGVNRGRAGVRRRGGERSDRASELQVDGYDLTLIEEMQYRLVPWNEIEKAELDEYRATEHRDAGRAGDKRTTSPSRPKRRR